MKTSGTTTSTASGAATTGDQRPEDAALTFLRNARDVLVRGGKITNAEALNDGIKQLKAVLALIAALSEAEDYFDGRADVIDGDYGEPRPNTEMRLLSEIRAALSLVGA